jgi:hypothetical protein
MLKRLFGICLAVALTQSGGADLRAGLIIGPDAGYLARAENHPYVGWVETFGSTGELSGQGSSVIINSHWVLSAAHVEQAGNGATASQSFLFGFGSNSLTNRGETKAPSEVFVHPNYRGTAGRGYDLALFYFENPFLTVTPVNRYYGDILVGQDSDIVGFGTFQMVNDPNSIFTGDRRAGNNVINSIFPGPLQPEYVSTRLVNQFFPELYRELQMGGRPGDSGGALIISGQLAGITSTAGGTGYNAFTTYSRLDNIWIDETIASRTTAVPEPSSLILLASVGLAVIYNRSRGVLSSGR